MKKVFVELEKLKNEHSGLGQFCLHIGEQLASLNNKRFELDFYVPEKCFNVFGSNEHYIKQTPVHKYLPYSKKKYDVWHCFHQDSKYMPGRRRTKCLLTIHDLNFLEKYKGLKRIYKLKALQRRVYRADAIVVISKFIEDEVRKHLDIGNKAVHIIFNGNSLIRYDEQETPANIAQYGDYFYSIGIISAKKNFEVLIPLLTHYKDMQLVIAGNNNTDYARFLLNLAVKLGVQERFHLVGRIDESQKFHFYKNCKAFALPSLTEGFGLPVVEALSLGIPTFLSDKTSLPEIGGPESFFWHSFELNNMVEVIEKGWESFRSDPDKVNRSVKWADKFSWKLAGERYLEIYETL